MIELLGFDQIVTAGVGTQEFFNSFNIEARCRKINLQKPNDQLDMSRDLLLTDAAHSLNSEWEIKGTTLYVWPIGVTINWPDEV